VGYILQNGRPNPPPVINLKARWLEELEFFSGQPITATIENSRLIIQPEMQF